MKPIRSVSPANVQPDTPCFSRSRFGCLQGHGFERWFHAELRGTAGRWNGLARSLRDRVAVLDRGLAGVGWEPERRTIAHARRLAGDYVTQVDTQAACRADRTCLREQPVPPNT